MLHWPKRENAYDVHNTSWQVDHFLGLFYHLPYWKPLVRTAFKLTLTVDSQECLGKATHLLLHRQRLG